MFTKSVPPQTVVAGNPARLLCTLEEYIARYQAKMLALTCRNREELWRQGLSRGRVMRCICRGGSMLPVLRDGDVVDLVPTQEFRIGDIVLARQALHRVVAKRNGQIITKGDANSRLDAPLTRGQILGRAVNRERRGRVRRLDSLEARFLGLAVSFTVAMLPGLIFLLLSLRNAARKASGWSRWATSFGRTPLAGTISPKAPRLVRRI